MGEKRRLDDINKRFQDESAKLSKCKQDQSAINDDIEGKKAELDLASKKLDDTTAKLEEDKAKSDNLNAKIKELGSKIDRKKREE